MYQWRSLDVLDIVPNRDNAAVDAVTKRLRIIGPRFGLRYFDHRDLAQRWNRTVRLMLFGQSEVKELRDFLDRRKGRAIPFWLPSWGADIALSRDITPPTSSIWIRNVGYGDTIYPMGQMRRHFWIVKDSGVESDAYHATGIIPVSDTEEKISFSPFFLQQSPRPMISYLRYCRLADDVQRISWSSAGYATCDLDVVEVPSETPA